MDQQLDKPITENKSNHSTADKIGMWLTLIIFVILPVIWIFGTASNWGTDIVDGVRNGDSKDWFRWILVFLSSTMFVWLPLSCYKIHKIMVASWQEKQSPENRKSSPPYHLGFWFFPDLLEVIGPILAFLYLIVMPFLSLAMSKIMKDENLDIGLIVFSVWVLIHYLFFGIWPGASAEATANAIDIK